MKFQVKWLGKILDEQDSVIYKRAYKSKSFVRNFATFLKCAFINSAWDVVTIDGASKNISWHHWYDYPGGGGGFGGRIWVNAPEGDDSYGLVVGSSSQVFNKQDYTIYSKIPHGEGDPGTLYYRECIVDNILESDRASVLIKRTFLNYTNSEAIYVREAGIVVKSFEGSRVLLVRDVFAQPFTVFPNKKLELTAQLEVVL